MQLLNRLLEGDIQKSLSRNPVTAIIGARQVGKSTLAKMIIAEEGNSIYLDLERMPHRVQLTDSEAFFYFHKTKLICIDEIQLIPDLFSTMRSVVDDFEFTGKFLVLGSASPELLRQSSETLAGRIAYFELTPFSWKEIASTTKLESYLLKGGFPKALLSATDEEAFEWLENFKMTFLERDLRMFGFNLPSEGLHRLWMMLAHLNGQFLNFSQLSNSLGIDQKTVRNRIDILHKTFMLRILPPYYTNTKKRLTKTPKIYLRDAGILHALLRISTYEELFGHPVYGSSWELVVIENVLQKYKKWEAHFFRTAAGAELDLVLTKANRKIVIEIKASSSPKVSRGFWSAIEIVQPDEVYIIAQVKQAFPFKENVWVYPLGEFLEKD